jgi:hypothetical protein
MALPVVDDEDDYKGYMRCCISCKQPWQCDPNTVGELATYMSFGMKGAVQKVNGVTNNYTKYYFGLELDEAHIIQRAHQTQAVKWACNPALDVTGAQPAAAIIVSRGDWVQGNTFQYTGSWNMPDTTNPLETVKHDRLRKFLFNQARALTDTPTLPITLFACKACNEIMDNEAKLVSVLYGTIRGGAHVPGLIPPNLITITVQSAPAALPETHVLPAPLSRQWFQNTRGCLVAWYLHSSLMYLAENRNRPVIDSKRNLAVLLSWIPLMVYVKYLDLKKPENGVTKPIYAYRGQVDLYVSLYQYVCFKAEYPNLDISFTRWHTFYFLEIPECQIEMNNGRPYWKPKTHPYVFSLIFTFRSLNRTHKEKLELVSDNLLLLYKNKIKPIITAVLLQQAGAVYTAEQLKLQRYFISPADINQIYNILPVDNIHPKYFSLQHYIDAVGITPIIFPCYRYCTKAHPTIIKALSNWMQFIIDNHEWKNIALNGKVNGMILSKTESALAYKYQYVLNLEDYVNDRSGMYDFLQRYESNHLLDKLKTEKICSIYKALPRLIKYDFTKDEWKARFLHNSH